LKGRNQGSKVVSLQPWFFASLDGWFILSKITRKEGTNEDARFLLPEGWEREDYAQRARRRRA
jgi:hypothetical protein